jgi:hypothetical protein
MDSDTSLPSISFLNLFGILCASLGLEHNKDKLEFCYLQIALHQHGEGKT